MPCNSDYMNPTEKEIKLKETAMFYDFALSKMGLQVPIEVTLAANAEYGGDDYVEPLCSLIKRMSEEQKETIIYNAKNRLSRKLADWYEEHLEADRKREAEEQKIKQQDKLRKSALLKLTKEERQSLGFSK